MTTVWMDDANMYTVLKAKIVEDGGIRATARKWKVSPGYVSDLAHGRRRISATVALRLGFRRCEKTICFFERIEKPS